MTTSLPRAQTTRLAATYLGIIMLMSLGFSLVIYFTSSNQLDRQAPPFPNTTPGTFNGAPQQDLNSFLQDRANEGKQALLIQLIELNIATLVLGSAFSYYLARHTLRPIEESIDAQGRFISDASHELRTPLTALQVTNEVALRTKELSPEIRDLITHNVEEAQKLKVLSDGLLGLLQEDGRTHNLQPISLREMVAEVVAELSPTAENKKITLENTVTDMWVNGHTAGLSRAITALLDNAIKYSPPGSTVHLSSEKRAATVYLHIRDHGIGISASDLPHIFQRFYRSDKARSKEKYDGFGLGLAIAQQTVQQSHGEISVVSTPGSGSTFTVKLPLAHL